jgi:hypothetical protein
MLFYTQKRRKVMKNFLKLLKDLQAAVERANGESLAAEDSVSDMRQEERLIPIAEDLLEELDERIGTLTADSQDILDLIETFYSDLGDDSDEE